MTDAVALQVKSLKKSFGQHQVLKGISLDARRATSSRLSGLPGLVKVPFCAVLTYLKPLLAVKFGSMVN